MKLTEQINKLIDSEEFIPVEMPVFYLTGDIQTSKSNYIWNNVYVRNFSQVLVKGPIFNYQFQQRLNRNKLSYIKNQIRSDVFAAFDPIQYKEAVKYLAPYIKSHNTQFLIKFTRSFNWKKGTYGDDNSCWFGSKSGARKMMQSHGGFAVQVHLNDKAKTPYGRCWGVFLEKKLHSYLFDKVDYENTVILFNGYKNTNLATIVRVGSNGLEYTNSFADMISYTLKIKYGIAVVLTNNKYISNTNLFINQNHGILLSKEKTGFYHTSKRRVELAYKEEEWAKCRNCGRVLSSDIIEIEDGHTYCLSCAEEYLEMCCYDMNIYHRRNLTIGPDKHYYHVNNILKVKEFARCAITDYIIFKKPETYLGNIGGEDIYISENQMGKYKICSCGESIIPLVFKGCRKCEKRNKDSDREKREIKFSEWLKLHSDGEDFDGIPF